MQIPMQRTLMAAPASGAVGRPAPLPQAERRPRAPIGELVKKARALMALFDLEGYEAAVVLLRRALEDSPGYAPAAAALGECYAYWGFRREIAGEECASFYALAARCAEHALRSAPELAETHRAAAAVARRGARRDFSVWKEETLTALDLEPKDPANWYEYWKAFGYDPAEPAVARVFELDPKHCGARIDLGAVLCEQGRLREAVRSFDLALESNPRNTLARYDRAMTLDRLGQAREASEELARAEALRPGDALLALGRACLGGSDA